VADEVKPVDAAVATAVSDVKKSVEAAVKADVAQEKSAVDAKALSLWGRVKAWFAKAKARL
jgi:hypothetical protein